MSDADTPPHGAREVQALDILAQVESLVQLEHPRTALEHAESAIEAAAGLSPSLRAAALHARARARDALGDLDGAEADLLGAAELDPDVPARWHFGAQIAASREDWDTARDRFHRAIAVAEAVGDRDVVPQTHWELGNLARVAGDNEAARREFEAGVASAEEIGDVASAAYCELALADLDAEQGDLASARQRYAHARSLREVQPDRGLRQVFAEPAAPVATAEPAALGELPPPPDDEPVLRVVFSPALVERVVVEHWPGAGASPRRVVVPFRFAVARRTEERLRWYTEDYTARPLDPGPAIAAEVELELEQLGETLFAALLGDDNASPIADAVRESLDRLRVEVVADVASADGIPWELLRDPNGGTDTALRARAITRTTSAALTAPAAGHQRGAMRILLVIARPEGRRDVAFRSVADPLLRELTASGARVSVDVLRPPTFERLQEVVRAARADGRPYGLVHFDGHGVFDDWRGGLVFESGDEVGTLVTGAAIGRELRVGGVALLVVNACRSAAGEAYGSVAQEALEEGLAAVVAMRFNVYVPTAALFMGRLYGALGEGGDLSSAVTEARRLLAERPERSGLPVVRDWCVPALYQAASVSLASGPAAERRGDAYAAALPRLPSHGFVGRDEVFVELEAALVSSPHVVLRAFAGAGKTTAATEFARWYARTGGGELELWDDVRTVDDADRSRLDEIAAAGGRVLLITDRLLETGDLPLVPMPNFPGEEGYALAMAVAAEAGASVAPEAAVDLVNGLRGHALAIELAVRELARRAADAGVDDVGQVLQDLVDPANGRPAPWASPLGWALELEGLFGAAALAAQFRGYVSVLGYGFLRDGGQDFDAAAAVLDELAGRGVLTCVNPAIYAIHPGLPVALAVAGRFEPQGRPFAEAMAQTASAWGEMAEREGGVAPWAAEVENIVTARRLASRERWWALVVDLLGGTNAVGHHGGMPETWRAEVLDAAPDLVDVTAGEPLPGMEDYGPTFLAHLASVAEMEGDTTRAQRLRTADVGHRRDAAAAALAVAADRRTSDQRGMVRRLAVGLTNLGLAQSNAKDSGALRTLTEAAALAHQLDDWRLEALNRLNLGVYWMTVPAPPDFDRADAEFASGYNLAVTDDPQLAGGLMTERGTVHYERGMSSTDLGVAQGHFRQAANHLQLAMGLREPDAVLFHQLGQVHRRLGEYDAARASFEQAIELREEERTPGAGADARLHLAQSLEEAGLLAEALGFARSAEAVLADVEEPDPDLQFEVERTVARLAVRGT